MKIDNRKTALIVVPTDTLAGAELTLKRIANYLVNIGCEVTVIFISNGNNGFWKDVLANKIYLDADREISGLYLLIKEFTKIAFNRQKFDYSFSSHVHCNAVISLARTLRLLSIKHQVMRESTNIFSWFKGNSLRVFRFYYLFYRNDAAIICQTNRMHSELLKNVPKLKANNTFVLSNAVDFIAIRKRSKNKIFKSNPAKEIVMVGRLVKEKGAELLLRSFSMLDDKSYRLRLIGSGPLQAELESLAEQLNIQNRVVFMGFSSNPIPYMREAKLSVVSSIIEGFPNTLLEMMCVARRVVATECTDGIKGMPGIITCPPNSETALLKAIEQSLLLDDKQVAKNIKSMRRHTSRLTVEKYVETIFKKVNNS